MGKLEPIDGKRTNWEGLWWHPEYNGFSSAVLSLSDLRKFKGKVRLYVRKNKNFNKGENGRPNYNFCLKDANSETFRALEVEDDEERAGDEETGMWIHTEWTELFTIYETYACSECEFKLPGYEAYIHKYGKLPNYCPNCGARLEG